MAAPVIIEPMGQARLTCVLVHGRGQVPQDMAPLVEAAQARAARIVLPVAEGKSWYKARAIDPMTPETEAELAASLAVLAQAVEAARAPGAPLILAGFSQGACLVAEYLMRVGSAEAACILTGARVGPGAGALPLRALKGMPVYLSGSDADPWIPLAAFETLTHDLHRAGARVRADMIPGRAHEMSAAEVAAFAALADELTAGRPLTGDAA